MLSRLLGGVPVPRLWYRLSWPREVEEAGVAGWFDQLAALHGRGSVVLEARATTSGVEHRLAVPATRARVVVNAARAAMPGLRLDPLDADYQPLGLRACQVRFTTHRRPLRTEDAELAARSVLTIMGSVGKGESLVMQCVLGP